MTTLTIAGLTKRYGPVTAVDGLGLVARPGRVTGFLGPNGAGKSTTLRMTLGLVRPDAGSATFDGVRYADLSQPTRTVGAVLDLAAPHPAMTARRHLAIAAQLGGHSAARVPHVLTAVDLMAAADRRVGTYSTGMRQRLALATALLGDPEVLVLDEPTNGLDPAGIRWLRDLVRARAAAGGTVLISSHQLSEVQQYVDDVVVVSRGRDVWSGPLTELGGAGDLEDAFLTLTGGLA